jgi:hypothetical protein
MTCEREVIRISANAGYSQRFPFEIARDQVSARPAAERALASG